jgi:hypothetical protein
MKNILIITALCLHAIAMTGQTNTDLRADSAAIVEAAMNYGDGWYSGDAARMEKAIHPDLNKICPVVMPQTGKTYLMISSWSGLIEPARAKAGFMEESMRKISAKVLKINDNVACAKVLSAQFNDYLALVKFDGQWKIVNVLWTFGPDSKSRIPMPDFKGDGEKPAVEQAMRDFMEGIYTSEVPRVEKVLHPEYRRASAFFIPSTGKTFIQKDAVSSIIEAVRNKAGALAPEKWNFQVNVIDIMDGLAFAELTVPTAFNYVQLAKIDGQWKIINILRKMAAQPPAKK